MNKQPEHIKQDDWESVDSPALSKELLSQMQPVHKQHPHIPPRVRGPQKDPIKISVSIRLSPEVIDFFKSQGKGWQTKINRILNEYVHTHHTS